MVGDRHPARTIHISGSKLVHLAFAREAFALISTDGALGAAYVDPG